MFTGDCVMKLTIDNLKNLILEVLSEESKKERIMKMLRGQYPDIETVGIMSGQNPMAQQTSDAVNDILKAQLEAEVKKRGFKFERIGGIFGGNSEKSLIIKNVDLQTMDELNRQFKQWGFVFGKKRFQPTPGERGELQIGDDGISGEYSMMFQMYKMDYENEVGFNPDEYASSTSQVMSGDELEGVKDNYSYIPGKGESGKILIPLYGQPVIPKTDEEIEKILVDLGSYSSRRVSKKK